MNSTLFILGTGKQRNNTQLGKNSENTVWQLDNVFCRSLNDKSTQSISQNSGHNITSTFLIFQDIFKC